MQTLKSFLASPRIVQWRCPHLGVLLGGLGPSFLPGGNGPASPPEPTSGTEGWPLPSQQGTQNQLYSCSLHTSQKTSLPSLTREGGDAMPGTGHEGYPHIITSLIRIVINDDSDA